MPALTSVRVRTLDVSLTPLHKDSMVTPPDQSRSFSLTPLTTGGVVEADSLISIRWVAIMGQAVALVIAYYGFAMATLPFWAALATTASAVLLNFAAMAQRRFHPYLAQDEAATYLAFDIIQLSMLIFLTGGLDNPFSIFLLAPIAVAASLLHFWWVMLLAVLTITCLTSNVLTHQPLPWTYGEISLPPLYGWAVWLGLVLTTLFIAGYTWSVSRAARRMQNALIDAQVSLASAQQVTALGALAAAVAHELGTPLATISLVAKEMLKEAKPNDPNLEDLRLLVSQAERCRQVLADFSRRPNQEPDEASRALPLISLIEEVAIPYRTAGKSLLVSVGAEAHAALQVYRSPELAHGLGNIIQNAISFARSEVEVKISEAEGQVRVVVADNGAGFPPALLTHIGEPYISQREENRGSHMGLGVFIAKTLIERSGAVIQFGNAAPGSRLGGAEVVMTWPRTAPLFPAAPKPEEAKL